MDTKLIVVIFVVVAILMAGIALADQCFPDYDDDPDEAQSDEVAA